MAALLLLLAANLNAQNTQPSKDIEIKISEPHKKVHARKYNYAKSNAYVVSVKFDISSYQFTIQTFDSQDLHEIARGEDVFHDLNGIFEFFTVLDDRFYLIYSLYDKPTDMESLFALEIDPKTASVTGEPQKLISVHGRYSKNFFAFVDKSEEIICETSKDNKYLMIHFPLIPENESKFKFNFAITMVSMFSILH